MAHGAGIGWLATLLNKGTPPLLSNCPDMARAHKSPAGKSACNPMLMLSMVPPMRRHPKLGQGRASASSTDQGLSAAKFRQIVDQFPYQQGSNCRHSA